MRVLLLKCIISAGFFSGCAFAESARIFSEPYLGVEASQNHQQFKAGFGKNLFPKTVQNYGVSIGSKFSKYFGLELGYQFQPKKGQDTILLPGNQLPGQATLVGTEFDGIHSSYKSTQPYLGIFAEYSSNLNIGHGKLKFQALIGVSAAKVKANITRLVTDGGIVSPKIINSFSQSKTIPIVKLSAAANLAKNLLVDISFNYRNMRRFKITSDLPSGTTKRLSLKMSDSFGVGIGLKYLI